MREAMEAVFDLAKNYKSNAEDMEATLETIRHMAFEALRAEANLSIPDFMARKEGAA